MPRYLVTGCAGFIGSTLVDALLAEGCEVVGIDAFTDYYPRDRKEAAIARHGRDPAFELIEHDLGTGPPPEAALEGVEGIFHLAARPGCARAGGRVRALRSRQRPGHARVAECAAGAGCASCSRPPRPSTATRSPIRPARTRAGPRLAVRGHQADLRAPAARPLPELRARLRGPSLLHGLRAPAAARHGLRADRGGAVGGPGFEVFGDGRQSRDFTFVRDAVAATILAMRKGTPGAVYNVGGGSEATLRESVEILEELSGRTLDVHYGRSPPATFAGRWRTRGGFAPRSGGSRRSTSRGPREHAGGRRGDRPRRSGQRLRRQACALR